MRYCLVSPSLQVNKRKRIFFKLNFLNERHKVTIFLFYIILYFFGISIQYDAKVKLFFNFLYLLFAILGTVFQSRSNNGEPQVIGLLVTYAFPENKE